MLSVPSGVHLNNLKGHSFWVTSVAFPPDGMCIVSGSFDQTLLLWGAASGEQLNTMRVKGHPSKITSVAFSPDGTCIVSTLDNETFRLWNAASGAHLNTLDGQSGSATLAAFSSGIRNVSGSSPGPIRQWSAVGGTFNYACTDFYNNILIASCRS
jgi:WD40 repeat protein